MADPQTQTQTLPIIPPSHRRTVAPSHHRTTASPPSVPPPCRYSRALSIDRDSPLPRHCSLSGVVSLLKAHYPNHLEPPRTNPTNPINPTYSTNPINPTNPTNSTNSTNRTNRTNLIHLTHLTNLTILQPSAPRYVRVGILLCAVPVILTLGSTASSLPNVGMGAHDPHLNAAVTVDFEDCTIFSFKVPTLV